MPEEEWIEAGQGLRKKMEEEADPTRASRVAASVKPDEPAYEIDYMRSQRAQRAVVRMLKGIVNVSDIVSINGGEKDKYLSLPMPLERIARTTEKPEITADAFIFSYIFGDDDHYMVLPQRGTEGGLGIIEPKDGESANILTKDGRTVYFDFDTSFFVDSDNRLDVTERGAKKSIDTLEEPTLQRLLEKLTALQERFDGEEGKAFLHAILSEEGKSVFDIFSVPERYRFKTIPPEEQFEFFYAELLRRIDTALRLVLKRRKEEAQEE